MAKKSSIEKNKHRQDLSSKQYSKRKALKDKIMDKTLSIEERFNEQLKLSKLPRNGSLTRVRNRCELTGRPRSFYRKFKLSRIKLRDLASNGYLPGVVKSSW